ncbi:DUF4440 domain-containing protein [bacterium]|nr:DUF4440 domain-containing protein [bacterium]
MKRFIVLFCAIIVIAIYQCRKPAVDVLFEIDRVLSANYQKGFDSVETPVTIFIANRGHASFASNLLGRFPSQPWNQQGSVASSAEDMAVSWGRLLDRKRLYATVWCKIEGQWKLEVQLGLIDSSMTPKWQPPIISDVSGIRDVMDVDLRFAAMADTAGSAAAFTSFIAAGGVAAGSGGRINRYDDFVARAGTDLSHKLRWYPVWGRMAGSKDLAYTIGKYTFARIIDDGEVTLGAGYYLSVWRKEHDNQWRFVFDGGNELIK